jgi:hypothetical protein
MTYARTVLVMMILWPGLAAAAPVAGGNPIVLENAGFRYEIGADGLNRSFVNRADGKDCCEPGQPFMVVTKDKRQWPSTKVEQTGKSVTVSFGDSGVQVRAKLAALPTHFTITIEQVTGAGVEVLQLCNLRLKITEKVGTMVNAAWDHTLGVCVLACNDRTDSQGADGARAALCASCYREYGLEGAKVAIVVTPTGGPDPAARMLDAIGRVEIAEGLPHPMLNGVWIKKAPERFASYLMSHDVGEENVDDIVEFARGGFGCIEIYPWSSTPTYGLNVGLFPHGMAGLKKVADRIHAAGLQLGLHSMQGMVGWGAKNDPYIVPKADPRLLQDRHATLAADLAEQATAISVTEGTQGWPDRGDLLVDGEIIRYGARSDAGFAECQRGLWGTTVKAHPKGTRLGHLVNCFPIWGGCVYCPDVNSSMIDEICDTIARWFNATGADMSYFDGGEEVIVQAPYWRNQGRIALGVQRRLKKPVVLEGNALYTHLSWHVITRGSPSFDPIYFGRREYTLRSKGSNPAYWAPNLLTGDVGWFSPHVRSLTTDAVTPDEVMLLCLKAVGGKAPISFHTSAQDPWTNKRMPEMLEVIRACDELKRTDYFTEEARAELAKPRVEHVLEQIAGGEWSLRPRQFGPSQMVNAGRAAGAAWRYANPYGEQKPWVRIRAHTQLAPYGAKENIVLADFGEQVGFKPAGSASADLTPSVESSTEKAPDGAAAFCYRAENKGGGRSAWCAASLKLPKPVDLTAHRRLGLWLRADGQGGLLNVQLVRTDARRDHYIDLNFSGWRYFELEAPDEGRYWDYSWPSPWTDLFYTCQPVYNDTAEVGLYYNDLPPGAKVTCLVSRIEALAEVAEPMTNPAIEVGGRRVTFPVTLKPDEYVELDWRGVARHFEANGGLIEEVKPEGSVTLAAGDNDVHFACAPGPGNSQHAEVTLSVRGEPLPKAKRPGAGTTAKYASLMAGAGSPDWALSAQTARSGRTRVLVGPYELVGGPPAQSIGAFDGTANAWTVDCDRKQPARAALVIQCGGKATMASYRDPRALPLETFEDLRPYEMSKVNEFEKYVIGGEKQLAACGPVRAGVTQTFVTSAKGGPMGRPCAVYSATNGGAAGGWGAKGKRFAHPLDLSAYKTIAFWLGGDGQGETLRFQFRDTAGRYADWLVPIDFAGWRLSRFSTADAPGFDWKHTEYVIFYYNDIPAGVTCTMKFAGLKALPAGETIASLRKPALTVNGVKLAMPATLAAGETLILDGRGRGLVFREGKQQRSFTAGAAVVLQPGANRLQLSCDRLDQAPDDVAVQVIPLGPR